MKRFWDARARENPFYYVDTRLRYDEPDLDWFWSQGERDLDRMLAQAGVTVEPDDVVVDLGCGVGRMTRALAGRARKVIAVDVSREMLARARVENAHLDNVRWLQGDGTSLRPLPDSSADACLSVVVLHHIPRPEVILGYIREMGRVLRAGGWAAFQLSTDPRPHRRARVPARSRLRALLGHGPRGQSDPRWRGTAVGLDALERAVTEAGMELERVVNPGELFCVVLARKRQLAPRGGAS